MTKLLEQALNRVRELPAERQDALASILLDELDAGKQWDEKLTTTGSQLETLAKQALDRDQRGESESKGWDEL